MSTKGLLHPDEVKDYTPIRTNFNPCGFREGYRIEYNEAVSNIGLELWRAMLAAQVDYTSVGPYQSGVDYALGTAVKYAGRLYVATTATRLQPPNITAWKPAPKFADTECGRVYEELFCTFLAPYLAFSVLENRLPYIFTQITDQGMSYGGRQINAQDAAAVGRLKQTVSRDKQQALDVMCHYLTDQTSTPDANPCLSGWIGLKRASETSVCGGCKTDNCNGCNGSQRTPGRYRFG